jgi:hypothetical protein
VRGPSLATGQAGPAVGVDQDASGPEVEVGQTGGVGRFQGVEQLEAELGHPADRERAVAGDQLVEGEGVDQLGGHVDDAVLDNHIVQADQAGMVQRGRRPHLGRHPVPQDPRPARRDLAATRTAGLRPTRPIWSGQGGEAELLDRQRAVGGEVGGPPDRAGGAAAERGVQHPAAGDEPVGGVLCHVGPKRYDQTAHHPKPPVTRRFAGTTGP